MSTSKLPLRLHGIHGDGILSGRAIHQAVKTKLISIEPFTVDQLNPASYDLRLGNKYKTYSTQQVLDSQKANLCNPTHEFDSLELRPGIGYLMQSAGSQQRMPLAFAGLVTIGRANSACALLGTTRIASRSGHTTGPPAENA